MAAVVLEFLKAQNLNIRTDSELGCGEGVDLHMEKDRRFETMVR